MKRSPRKAKESLFNRQTIGLSLLQGSIVLIVILIVYIFAIMQHSGEMEARALAFTSIVIANLGLILINRSWSETILSTLRRPNRALWVVFGGTLLFLGLILTIPPLQDLFRFSTLGPTELGFGIAAGVVSIIWFEFFKWVNHHRVRSYNE